MEAISVAVRVRPLSSTELSDGSRWSMQGNKIFLTSSGGFQVPGTDFSFDHVFSDHSSTEDVYDTRAKEIANSFVNGFHGTIFAYGQTSSGKTFTMRGTADCPGIIPLCVQEVFETIQAQAQNREFLLRVSYLEIYNEEINDLLAPQNKRLQIHESVERGVFVAGLSETVVNTPEMVMQLLQAGEVNRAIGETKMNEKSSRSHAIFRMVLESRDIGEGDSGAVLVSNLNLVDLAGSERASKTGAEGSRLKEGGHINKSLMILGTVINKLSESGGQIGIHVPFRDSKLTRILQPSLGGNTKTAIICCITPAKKHEDETLGTLRFASRAKRITNCAQVNEVMSEAALLKRQMKEIENLRKQLELSNNPHLEHEIMNLRNQLLQVESDSERMRWELEEQRAAQAAKEQLIAKQERKIESLSTLVIKSAADEHKAERKAKKENRRETWCPKPQHNLASLKNFEPVSEEDEAEETDEEDTEAKRMSKVATVEPSEAVLREASAELSPPLPVFRKKATDSNEDLLRRIAALEAENSELRSTRSLQGSLHGPREAAGEGEEDEEEESSANGRRAKSMGTPAVATKELQEQVKTLEEQRFYMQREIDFLDAQAKEQAEQGQREREELQEQVTNLQHQLQEAQEKASGQCEAQDGLVAELRANVAAVEEELLRMSEEREREEARACQAEAEAEELRTVLEGLQARAREAEQALAEAKRKAERALLEREEARMEGQRASEEREGLRRGMQELEGVLGEREREVGAWRERAGQLETAVAEMQVQAQKMEEEAKMMGVEKASLSARVDQLLAEAESSKAALAESAHALQVLQQQRDQEVADLRRELVSARKEASSARGKPALLERERDALAREGEKRKAKLADAEQKLKSALQERAALQADKINLEKEVKRLAAQSAQLSRDLSRVEQQDARRKETAGAKEKADKLLLQRTTELEERERALAQAEVRRQAVVEEIPASLSAVTAERDALQRTCEQQASEVAALQAQLQAAQEQAEAAQAEAEERLAGLQGLEAALLAQEEVVKELEGRTEEQAEEGERLRRRVEELMAHSSALEEKLASSTQELEQVTEQLTDIDLDRELLRAKAEAATQAADQALQEQQQELRRLQEELREQEARAERGRQAEEEAAALRERVGELERAAEAHGGDSGWQAERKKLQDEVLFLKGKKASYRKTLLEWKDRIENLDARLVVSEEQRMQLQEAMLEVVKKEKRAAQAAQEGGVKNQEKSKGRLMMALLSAQDKVRVTLKEMESLKKQVSELDGKKSELEASLEEAQSCSIRVQRSTGLQKPSLNKENVDMGRMEKAV